MSTAPPPTRLNYLDQFRGYTVFGMIVVNFLGNFKAQIHPIFHHHNTYCSYADTIMPQFFFAVGFALRYTMVKRIQTEGWASAHLRIVRRVFALLLIAAIVHGFDKINANWETLNEKGLWYWLQAIGSRNFFQTLTHIAVTTLWVLPVIGRHWSIRLVWLLGSAVLHVWCSHEFYLKFALERPVIDGGPLGFLTWTIPVLVGSFVSDLVTQPVQRPIPQRVLSLQLFMALLSLAAPLMLCGYMLSCLHYPLEQPTNPAPKSIPQYPNLRISAPPFMPPHHPTKLDWETTYEERHRLNKHEVVTLFTMSQQTGSVSYLTFGAGFSVLVLALCYLIFGQTRQIGLFRTLGSNALVAYIVQGMSIDAVASTMPKDGPLWSVLLGLMVVVAITWVVCYSLEKKGWYVRV